MCPECWIECERRIERDERIYYQQSKPTYSIDHFHFVFRVLARVSQIFSFVFDALCLCRVRWQITNECSDVSKYVVRSDWYANWHLCCERKRLTRIFKRATNILLSFFSVCSIFHVVFAYEMALRSRVIRTTQPTAKNLCIACVFFSPRPNQVPNGAATSDNEHSLFNKRTSSSSSSAQ